MFLCLDIPIQQCLPSERYQLRVRMHIQPSLVTGVLLTSQYYIESKVENHLRDVLLLNDQCSVVVELETFLERTRSRIRNGRPKQCKALRVKETKNETLSTNKSSEEKKNKNEGDSLDEQQEITGNSNGSVPKPRKRTKEETEGKKTKEKSGTGNKSSTKKTHKGKGGKKGKGEKGGKKSKGEKSGKIKTKGKSKKTKKKTKRQSEDIVIDIIQTRHITLVATLDCNSCEPVTETDNRDRQIRHISQKKLSTTTHSTHTHSNARTHTHSHPSTHTQSHARTDTQSHARTRVHHAPSSRTHHTHSRRTQQDSSFIRFEDELIATVTISDPGNIAYFCGSDPVSSDDTCGKVSQQSFQWEL